MSAPRLSREEQANLEVGQTDISHPLARGLTIAFLLFIFGVPLIQIGLELRDGKPLQALRLFTGLDEVGKAYKLNTVIRDSLTQTDLKGTDGSGWNSAGTFSRLLTANAQLLKQITDFENEQKEVSFLTTSLVEPVQARVTRSIGLGNEKAWPGREGWLFFRPGINYLTKSGFLEPKTLAGRAASGNEFNPSPQPDPRLAIREFANYLAARDIRLVLVPAPNKAQIYPEMLTKRYAGREQPLQNPSWKQFVADVEQMGVKIIDVAPILFADKSEGRQYLATDTHWTPTGMETAAGEVATWIAQEIALGTNTLEITREIESITQLGDIAAKTLQLSNRTVYAMETVEIRPVHVARRPWTPTEDSEVLLLGDSFANMYSDDISLGWGARAGLAEQLSAKLRRPVQTFTENDNGAYATRVQLFKKQARQDVLANTKVVVWEFAARELAVGNWKLLNWERLPTTGTQPEQSDGPPKQVTNLEVTGVIEQIALPPDPSRVNYPECISAIHLKEVQGLKHGDEIVVYVWGMRNKKHTAVTKWKVGETRTFTLNTWGSTGFEKARKEELDDPDLLLIDLPEYWGDGLK